jgi:hypothetical protein
MTPSQTSHTGFIIGSIASNYDIIISMPIKHRVAVLIFSSYTL